MRKSWITGAFALTATAALLAGCSGGGDATTDEDGGDAVDASGVELTVWVDENREPAVAAAAEQFETDTGATVTLVQKDFADLRADFLAQVPTGEGPDMTIGAHDWLGEFVASGVVNKLDLG